MGRGGWHGEGGEGEREIGPIGRRSGKPSLIHHLFLPSLSPSSLLPQPSLHLQAFLYSYLPLEAEWQLTRDPTSMDTHILLPPLPYPLTLLLPLPSLPCRPSCTLTSPWRPSGSSSGTQSPWTHGGTCRSAVCPSSPGGASWSAMNCGASM